MFKLFRWTFYLVGFLIIGGVIAAQFINLNQFKELAVTKVKEATGRDLAINGDIKLSFYPVLGAQIDDLSLSNIEGAKNPSMAEIKRVLVGVKVMPLLEKRVELDRIVVEQPVLNLEKTKSGKVSWDLANAEQKSAATSEDASTGNAPPLPVILSGVNISDGTVRYIDHATGNVVEVTKLNSDVTFKDMNSPLKIDARALVKDLPIVLKLETDSPASLMSKQGSRTFIEGSVQNIPFNIKALAAVQGEYIRLDDLDFRLKELNAVGDVDVRLGGAAPIVNATLDFGTTNIDELIALAKMTADAQPASDESMQKQAEADRTQASYVAAAAFAAADGAVVLTANKIFTKEWSVMKPQLKANMANGIIALAAGGQFAAAEQNPLNITFESQDVARIFSKKGGYIVTKAKGVGQNIAARGSLSVIPQRVAFTSSTINYNEYTIKGDTTLGTHSGDQALDAQLQIPYGGREWDVGVKTSSLKNIQQSEGAPLELVLRSGSERVRVNATVSKVDDLLKLKPMKLNLNSNEGNGYVTVDQSTKVPSVKLGMDFDVFDVGPLLALASGGNAPKAASGAAASSGGADAKSLPLKAVNADVVIKAGTFKFKDLALTNVQATAKLQDGILNFDLPDAGLYGGRTSLKAKVDGTKSQMSYVVDSSGKAVDLGKLLRAAAQNKSFDGTADWSADITGVGTETPGLYKNLNGKGSFAVDKGVVRGMNLLTLMSDVRGQFAGGSFVKTTDETNQLNATGTFTIKNGVISNDDLVARSPNLEASGKGTVSLPAWSINYRIDPKVGEKRKSGEGEKFVGQSVPVEITGSIDNPKIKTDTKALVGRGIDALKTIKEGGIGEKIEKYEKYLTPFGLGGTQKPEAEAVPTEGGAAAPVVEDNAPPAQAQDPLEQLKKDPLKELEKLKNLF